MDRQRLIQQEQQKLEDQRKKKLELERRRKRPSYYRRGSTKYCRGDESLRPTDRDGWGISQQQNKVEEPTKDKWGFTIHNKSKGGYRFPRPDYEDGGGEGSGWKLRKKVEELVDFLY